MRGSPLPIRTYEEGPGRFRGKPHPTMRSFRAGRHRPSSHTFLGLSVSLYRMGCRRCLHRSTLGQTSEAAFGERPISKHSCHPHCYEFRLGSGGNSLHPRPLTTLAGGRCHPITRGSPSCSKINLTVSPVTRSTESTAQLRGFSCPKSHS